jgi:nucleotide-binding universal stress UspA family protein
MATSGRLYVHGHYVGSAAETLVRRLHRQTMLIGAKARVDDGLNVGRVVVPLDGSKAGEEAVALGAQWAQMWDVPLWLISVVAPKSQRHVATSVGASAEAMETNYVRRQANRLLGADLDIDIEINWEVMYRSKPAAAIVDFAGDDGLVVMSTHGRSGLARIALGSVATDVVRRSHLPVVVHRPTRTPLASIA